MNRYEELLVKASACLSDASKIEDPLVRAKVLDLAYHSQMVAKEIILQEIDAAWLNASASNGAASSPPLAPLNRP